MADQILEQNHTTYWNYKHEATISFKIKLIYFGW